MTKTLFTNNKKQKELFLKVYRKTLGNVTMACTACGILRSAFMTALKNDAEFAQAIADADEAELDFGESKLKERMQKGDIQAIKFFLETKGKYRGYGKSDQLKITGSKDEPLEINGKLDVKMIQEAAIQAAAKAINDY